MPPPLRRFFSRLSLRARSKSPITQPQPRRTIQTDNKPRLSTPQTRLTNLLARLPRPLRKYTSRLSSAPLSHVVAFLVLHEITAIVPLFALFGVFHYTEILPVGWGLKRWGGEVKEGAVRFERWFSRRGWFGFGGEEAEREGGELGGEGVEGKKGGGGEEEGEEVLRRWGEEGNGRYRIVVEIAVAYALTKALLPVRIVGSLWATPWFAGVLVRLRGLAKR